jgi:peptidoglycan/LPS O-acetylase OafA/YrhL
MVVTSAHAFGSPSAGVDFMRRRITRIVPLYWAVTTVALAAALVVPNLMKVPSGADHYPYILSSYLFWPYARLTGDVRPLATPGWTLKLEMLFYVVFAMALFFPRRVGLSLLFGSLGVLVAARVSGVFPGVALNFWGDPIVLGFLFGAAVGIAHYRGVRVSGPWAVSLLGIGFAALMLPPELAGAEDDLLCRLAPALPATAVVAAVALGPQVNDSRRMWWPALAVGDASYSLYLVHEFLLRPFHFVWAKEAVGVLPLWMFVPAGIAIALLAAFATYYFFERPVTRWLNAAKGPKRASRPPTFAERRDAIATRHGGVTGLGSLPRQVPT